ncbi:transcript variant X3 [Nothobranchius furzeri]|uniref:Dual specificity phosphatase 28 n=1 Tax=Nothobranchius furzeri TaxID=105023 RepID=A0A1A7ZBL7_NOTFU|nr:transcript variant X1 [Nothobranchius furzeri]KAF7221856.1 transcript variant X2 [Nothobranchius furzeri]KAF7221857.1 transcript variant X3 [Nothobranchius furzeri]
MLQLCKVTSSLFISNARSACSTELLQQEAVTLCINISRQQPFPSSSVTKLQIPVYDDPSEDLYSHFDHCADAIQKEASRGGRSLVYCKNGRSRSATICIAFLMKHHKVSLTEAVQRVKTARHVIDPNPGFMSQLRRYEEVLKRRRREFSEL